MNIEKQISIIICINTLDTDSNDYLPWLAFSLYIFKFH